jgi:hypothetical protein
MKKIVVPALLLIVTISSSAETATYNFTTGLDYSSGKYGQIDTTDITCIPFTGKVEFERTTLKLTIPWIQIVGTGAVTGGANNQIVLGNSKRVRTRESGLGDIVTSATYSLVESSEYKFVLDVTGKVKFGTASYDKGLGTGENDFTFETDAYKTFDKFTLLGTIGYRTLGEPAQINLNNVWFTSFGAGYKIDSSNSAGAYLDLRQATSATGTNLREYTAYYVHKFNPQYKLQSYLIYGDTRSSADWGGGIMLGYSW